MQRTSLSAIVLSAAGLAMLALPGSALAARGDREHQGRNHAEYQHRDARGNYHARGSYDRGRGKYGSVRGGVHISTGHGTISIGGHYQQAYRPSYRHHVAPARLWVPGRYDVQHRRVLVQRGHYTHHRVPAQYRTVYRHGCPVQVLVRPSHVTKVWVPDQYTTHRSKVWVPGYWQHATAGLPHSAYGRR